MFFLLRQTCQNCKQVFYKFFLCVFYHTKTLLAEVVAIPSDIAPSVNKVRSISDWYLAEEEQEA